MPRPQIHHHPQRPIPAPVEFAGQWVAWNRQLTEIVAHGRGFAEVRAAAPTNGHPNAIFERVHDPRITFIGNVA